mgnify:CR=1 FL=1
MTIGDQPAFPVRIDNNGEALKTPVAWGMTYRQWLVGQIAGGVMANPDAWRRFNPDELTHEALTFADAIIKRLEEEGK